MCAMPTHKNQRRGEIQQMNKINQRLVEISETSLIVGVDIARNVHWARFVDYRGREISKAISFKNNRQGFENIETKKT